MSDPEKDFIDLIIKMDASVPNFSSYILNRISQGGPAFIRGLPAFFTRTFPSKTEENFKKSL